MKIAFTSCFRREAFPKQPVWQRILEEDPDYLFLLGDTIYMDYGWKFLSREPSESPRKYSLEKFKAMMVEKYEKQFAIPEFKVLVQHMRNKKGFYAIWDDHDFAWDNARGGEMATDDDIAKKEFSRQCFHKYLNCSTNLPEVYYHIDTPLARVIFLDNRYYATGKKLINNEQFTFLENKLNNHSLPYTVVCAGLTLHNAGENWSIFPESEQRLYDILNSKGKGVLFLAGDIHANRFHEPFVYESKTARFFELIASGAAINKIGLPFKFDNLQNWGLLHLHSGHFKAEFYTSISTLSISKTIVMNEWPAPRRLSKQEWRKDHRPW